MVGYDLVVKFVQHWKQLSSDNTPLANNPGKWRSLFGQALEALNLQDYGFRPYSLRRGGATWWFAKHGSLDKILLQGRWAAPKTARIYINEGLSILAELSIPPSAPSLAPFLHIFNQQRSRLTISTLEPPVPGRAGGAGNKARKGQKKGSKHRSEIKRRRRSKNPGDGYQS